MTKLSRSHTLLLGLAAAGIVLAAGIGFAIHGNTSAKAQASAETAIPAAVLQITHTDSALWQTYSGRLEPIEAVDLRARVSGAVRQIYFQEGSLVRKGDVLVEIDPEPYQADVERLAAQVGAAEARVRHTDIEAERANKLAAVQAVSLSVRDERVRNAQEARAQLNMAQAELRRAKLDLSYTRVRAPIDGRIGRREITVGNLVDAGPSAPVLASIYSVHPIYAAFEADERTVFSALAEIGHDRARLATIPVSAEVDGLDAPVSGRLQLIDNRIDERAGTVRLRATIDNASGALTPGQFVRIRLGRGAAAPIILIPEDAVRADQSRRFVLIVDKDNRAEYRQVQVGQGLDGQRVVTDGLVPGEKIVVSNLQRLRPGALVAPRAPDAPAGES